MEIQVKNQVFQVKAEEWKNQIWFHLEGRIFVLDKIDRQNKVSSPSFARQTQKHTNKQYIISPMPGQIVKVLVEPGTKVMENQTLLILSSMKMEYVLKSSGKGVVKSVHVKAGETVSSDQTLVEIN